MIQTESVRVLPKSFFFLNVVLSSHQPVSLAHSARSSSIPTHGSTILPVGPFHSFRLLMSKCCWMKHGVHTRDEKNQAGGWLALAPSYSPRSSRHSPRAGALWLAWKDQRHLWIKPLSKFRSICAGISASPQSLVQKMVAFKSCAVPISSFAGSFAAPH